MNGFSYCNHHFSRPLIYGGPDPYLLKRLLLFFASEILIFCWPCISIYLFININQLDALNFIISLFQASTCFEHMYSSSGGPNCIIQSLVSSHQQLWWYQRLYNTILPSWRWAHTYSCDDTRDCIIQFCPPDDEHMCSKHVEAWNKLIIKLSASSWLILINKYCYYVTSSVVTDPLATCRSGSRDAR